jgi:hypothetical protein
MKRMFTLLACIAIAVTGYGQKSVDALFKKYANSDDFVTISINGDLLKFIDNMDDDGNNNKDHHCFPLNVSEIRILAQQDTEKKVENFYDMVIRDIDRSDYEEFMRVNGNEHKMIMLVRTEGRKIKEFLLVAGGKDNAVIQIKGDLTIKDAKKISADFEENCHMNLISKKN